LKLFWEQHLFSKIPEPTLKDLEGSSPYRPAQVWFTHVFSEDEEIMLSLKKTLSSVKLTRWTPPQGVRLERLGPWERGQGPQVFDQIFDLIPGVLSELLRSDYGYHFFLIEEHRPARICTGAEALAYHRQEWIHKQQQERLQTWFEGALGSTPITHISFY
jgi:hypothetical protein